MGNLCGGDIFKQLQEKYGADLAKLVVAEKGKEAVAEKFKSLTAEATSKFASFTTDTNKTVGEKSLLLDDIFKKARVQVDSTLPGGVATIEKLQNKSFEQIGGLSTFKASIEKIKTQALTTAEAKKTEVLGGISAQKDSMISKIEAERPKLPIYESLPDPLRLEVLNKGTQAFASEISKNKEGIAGQISKNLDMSSVTNMLQGIGVGGKLDSLLGGVTGQLGDITKNFSGMPSFSNFSVPKLF